MPHVQANLHCRLGLIKLTRANNMVNILTRQLDTDFMVRKLMTLKSEYCNDLTKIPASLRERVLKLTKQYEKEAGERNKGPSAAAIAINNLVRDRFRKDPPSTLPWGTTVMNIVEKLLVSAYPESAINLEAFRDPQALMKVWQHCKVVERGALMNDIPDGRLYVKQFGDHFGVMPGFYTFRPKFGGKETRQEPAVNPNSCVFDRLIFFLSPAQRNSKQS